jgi:hypothetical protein
MIDKFTNQTPGDSSRGLFLLSDCTVSLSCNPLDGRKKVALHGVTVVIH